jgi:energy-converting hydrogenase A subunit M
MDDENIGPKGWDELTEEEKNKIYYDNEIPDYTNEFNSDEYTGDLYFEKQLAGLKIIDFNNEYKKYQNESITIKKSIINQYLIKNNYLIAIAEERKKPGTEYLPLCNNDYGLNLIMFKDYLLEELSKLNDGKTLPINNNNDSFDIKWNEKYSQNDFLELCKALIESQAIIGKQKDIIEGLSQLFNIEIKHPDQQLQSMKQSRNNDTQTKFLDKLKLSLINWINKEKSTV